MSLSQSVKYVRLKDADFAALKLERLFNKNEALQIFSSLVLIGCHLICVAWISAILAHT